jgi:hypothetical protein
MQPDLVWAKTRSAVDNHVLMDTVRGVAKRLYSNLTNAEDATGGLVSVNSNGFSLDSSAASINNSGQSYVAWQWKEGATPGFDVVTYTGTGANRTVAHSLGVAPAMMIVKSRSAVIPWRIYHSSRGATKFLEFTTGAEITQTNIWNDTAPTSSVFTVGADSGVNGSGASLVAYLFSEVAGFSKFGSYTGNGSADGPFVFCGFRPRFIMWKRTDAVSDWVIQDTAANTSNVASAHLYPNSSIAESSFGFHDILSNGFKLRQTNSTWNTSGGTYIFMAFAETPQKFSLAR